MKQSPLLTALLIIIGAILLRLVPHVPNFAPITAAALFGGVYLPKKYAVIIPLVAMILSDYLLLYIHPFGNEMITLHHLYPLTAILLASTPYVWGSFVISGLIGMWLRNHKTPQNILIASLISSVLFFLVTNFGFWLALDLYPKTISGQITAYAMAIPFFRWTLLGDLFYTTMFFGSYELGMKLGKEPKAKTATIV